MSDIFLCYSRTDSEMASRLEMRLLGEGWSVFRDIQTHVGRRWHNEIEKELHAARAVVVLWSAKSSDSDYVLEEAQYGKDKEILFPAFIEKVEFPYGFRRIQTADLIGWSGERAHAGLDGLLEALTEHLGSANACLDEASPIPAVIPKPARKQSPTPGATFRDRLKDGSEGPLMVAVPPGRFMMGSPPNEPGRTDSEGPQHPVTLSRPFAMGVYAVTFDEFDAYYESEKPKQGFFASLFSKSNKPGDQGWGRGQRPVINVSWQDAQAYCAWLSQQTGQPYRLPTEAEWEYACRAGTTTPFHHGDRITPSQANFDGRETYNGSPEGKYRKQTLPVGSFSPNVFGLYDMHGNVWEWCQDTWHENYAGAPDDGSAWEADGTMSRVLRGGAWYFNPGVCRAAFRFYVDPVFRGSHLGFRVCRVAPID